MTTKPVYLTYIKLAMCLSLLLSVSDLYSQIKKEPKEIWMLTYFRQRYPTRIEINAKGETIEVPLPDPMLIAKLHIALSTDGRHWTALNDNKPVWDQFVRDQFIHRGPDGLWRLIATGGSSDAEARKKYGPSCTFATSKDLIHWQFEQSLYLMKDVKNEAGELVNNIWAPEFYYDETAKEYTIFWSSTFEDAGWKKKQTLVCQNEGLEDLLDCKSSLCSFLFCNRRQYNKG